MRVLLCPQPQGSRQQGLDSSPGRFWSLRSLGLRSALLWAASVAVAHVLAMLVFLLCFCKRLCALDISPLSARGCFPASVV